MRTRWIMLRRRSVELCGRLGIKLSLLSVALVALLSLCSSVIVIEIMEGFLFREMVKRGGALAVSMATPAGYSILAEDRLGLDHLAARIVETQEDIVYVAIVDPQGHLLAHSRPGAMETKFRPADGEAVLQRADITVRREMREGQECYAFQSPILFLNRELGAVHLGIASSTLVATTVQARLQILAVALAILLLGTVGSLFLTRIVTGPLKRLSAGVAQLRSGHYGGGIKPASRDELGALTRDFNAMAKELLAQKESLARYAAHLEESNLATVKILAAAIDARDRYTLGHSQRVAQLSIHLGRKLGLDATALKDLEMACFLHDVGKIRVPDRILHKPGPLDEHEQALIVRHSEFGSEILDLAASLQRFIPVVRYHHERYDGKGYPAGLKGDEIPPFAAIVAIADSYDAMVSSRPYRPGLAVAEAVAEIRRCRGTQFSPHLTDLFIEAVEEMSAEGDYSAQESAV